MIGVDTRNLKDAFAGSGLKIRVVIKLSFPPE